MGKKQEVALSAQQLTEAVVEYVVAHNLVVAGDFEAVAYVRSGAGVVALTFNGTAVEAPPKAETK